MNDLATLNGKPKALTAGGRTYLVHPLSVDDFAGLQAWVDGQFPDPFDVASAAIERGRPGPAGDRVPYSVAQQKHLYEVAMDRAAKGAPRIGTPEADALIASAAGVKEMIFLAIRKGDGAFTREAAAGLFKELDMGQVAKVFTATNADMVIGDPKAPAGDGTTTA